MLRDLIHFRDRVRMVFSFNGGASSKRAGRRRYLNNMLLHFRPATVTEATLPLRLSWGLGGMAAVLVVVQWCTGGLLNFVYEPIPSLAYESVQTIRDDVAFGRLVRNLHHWGAWGNARTYAEQLVARYPTWPRGHELLAIINRSPRLKKTN